MCVGVRHNNAASKQLNSRFADRWQLADSAISHISHAAECLQNGGVHVTNERSPPRRAVHVLQDQNPRRRNLYQTVPKIGAIVIRASLHGWLAAAQPGRHGIAHYWLRVLEDAANAAIRESRVSQADAKGFDRVCDRTAVNPTQSVQLFFS